MEESVSVFPFHKLRYDKYLTLDIMMHVEFKEACSFMFGCSKATRAFLESNSRTIQNGFINGGLIVYDFFGRFHDFELLERLYFQALKRNFSNRIITLNIGIYQKNILNIFIEVVRWIYEQ